MTNCQCPECNFICYNPGGLENGVAMDFYCAECNCEFTVDIHVTKHGYKRGAE